MRDGPTDPERGRRPAAAMDGRPTDGADDDGLLSLDRRSMLLGGAAAGGVGAAGVAGWLVLGADGESEVAGVPFDESIEFASAYGIEVTARQSDGSELTLQGRVDGEDHYMRFQSGGRQTESYLVDGDSYLVTDGDCLHYPDATATDENGPDAAPDVEERTDDATLTPAGTTVLDGREVRVYEVAARDLAGAKESLTYYVDSETDHLRRLETPTTVVDYHSWGSVASIEPPDVECRQPQA